MESTWKRSGAPVPLRENALAAGISRGTVRRVDDQDGYFGEAVAARYDESSTEMFDPVLVEKM